MGMRFGILSLVWVGIILFLAGAIVPASAVAQQYNANDYASKNSCVSNIALFDRLSIDMFTLGIGEAIFEGFSLENADLPPSDRPAGVGCKDYRSTISFCYDPWVVPGVTRWHGGTSRDCDGAGRHNYDIGDIGYIDGVAFQAVNKADTVCMQFWAGTKWATLGCKYRKDPSIPYDPNTACFVSSACADKTFRTSKTFMSITGVVAQCISETLQKLFQDTNNCLTTAANGGEVALNVAQSSRSNLFMIFQQSMKKAITAALTLYVIFFGIKVVLGQEIPKKSELFIFVLKMILVVYFALGTGLGDFLYPTFKNASTSLSSIMFRAGGAEGLCAFDPASYRGDSTMSLWDALDCRIAFYLGITDPNKPLPLLLALTIYLLPLVFFHLIFIIFSLAFAVFFMSIAMYVVHNYILCLIFMTFTLYLGPLFVPMVLFKQTRGYFDGWLKLLLSFALQPVVLFGFLALILTIFDNIIYAGCKFTSAQLPFLWDTSKTFSFFYIDLTGLSPENERACRDSVGYQFSMIAKDSSGYMTKIDLIFLSFFVFDGDFLARMFVGMLKLVLFGFVAAHFLEVLSGFAAELTGGQNIRDVSTSPMNVAAAVKNKLGAMGKSKGDEKGKGKGKEEKEEPDKNSSDSAGAEGEGGSD